MDDGYRRTKYTEVNGMVNNGYNQYLRSKVMTASKAELTLMLYEGAIKFCNMGLMAMEKGNIPEVHKNITKAEAIIDEFRATLNYKYAVANDFNNVYMYVRDCMVEANISKKPEKLEEAVGILREMRDTWKEVMRLTAQQKSVAS